MKKKQEKEPQKFIEYTAGYIAANDKTYTIELPNFNQIQRTRV